MGDIETLIPRFQMPPGHSTCNTLQYDVEQGQSPTNTTEPNRNYAILLTNLPHKVPGHAILSEIRNTGKIYWFDLERDYNRATIMFWDQEGANKFFNQCAYGNFKFKVGMSWTQPPPWLLAHMEQRQSAETAEAWDGDGDGDGDESRMLRISTPVNVVIRKRLRSYFGERIGRGKVEISKSELGTDDEGQAIKTLTCYFSCFKGEAEEAYRLLQTDFKGGEYLKLGWGQDPCA